MRDGPSADCGRRDVDGRDVQTMLGGLAALGLARRQDGGLGLACHTQRHSDSGQDSGQRTADSRNSKPHRLANPHLADKRVRESPGAPATEQ